MELGRSVTNIAKLPLSWTSPHRAYTFAWFIYELASALRSNRELP